MSNQEQKKDFNLWKLMFLIENACVLLALIIVGIVMIVKISNRYDPTPYLQSVFDVKYKNDYHSYIDGGYGTIADADEYRNDTLVQTFQYLTGRYAESYDEAFMDEINGIVTEGMDDLYSKINYEIVGYEQTEKDKYTVTVSCKPIDFSNCDEETLSNAVDQVFVDAQEEYINEGAIPTQESFYGDIVLTGFKTMYQNTLENPQYGEETLVKIRFEKKDDVYVVKNEDLQKLDAVLFNIDEEETFFGKYSSDEIVSKMVDTVFFIQAGEFANELINGDNTLLENWLPDDAAVSAVMRDQILRSIIESFLNKKEGTLTDDEYAQMSEAMSNLMKATKISLKSIKKTSDTTYKVTYQYQKSEMLNQIIPAYNKVINKKGRSISRFGKEQYMIAKAKLFSEALVDVTRNVEYDKQVKTVSYEYDLAYGLEQYDFYEKVWAVLF